ncbi:hypothetical protein [Bacillus gaemokensis]|uniref:Uncharacterized protein n=1 Tax=Bacillus gaemokensis TaxID=574375 RepID=A0A073KLT4_9BACI|nr:hypothetical protein [Bacillus gaemokensis]KEK23313.1 hypothetical protein BAGA_09325 [Bacillus gaemokensis]KYG37899.1 hypothetical protein AZF08_21560 [Bacillus gaemokensis]
MQQVIERVRGNKRIQNIIIIAGFMSILLGPEELNIYTGVLYSIILGVIVYISSYLYLARSWKGIVYSAGAVFIIAALYGIFIMFFPEVHYIGVIIIVGVVGFIFTYFVGK